MEEGKLSKWLVKVGDTVKSGDVLAEIETDKATMEVEWSMAARSRTAGRRRHRRREGQHADRAGPGEGETAAATPVAKTAPEPSEAPVVAAEKAAEAAPSLAAVPAAPKFEAAERSRSARRRRDGRDDRAPGAQRGDGRRAAPRQGRLRHGRGSRRVSGRLQDHPEPAAGIRPAAHHRYADHRARLCRSRRRRRLCRPAGRSSNS